MVESLLGPQVPDKELAALSDEELLIKYRQVCENEWAQQEKLEQILKLAPRLHKSAQGEYLPEGVPVAHPDGTVWVLPDEAMTEFEKLVNTLVHYVGNEISWLQVEEMDIELAAERRGLDLPEFEYSKPALRVRGLSEDVALRRAIVKALTRAYPRAKGKSLDRQTCEQLDLRRVSIPMNWQEEFDVTTWSEAYQKAKIRPRIQKMFSTDRKK